MAKCLKYRSLTESRLLTGYLNRLLYPSVAAYQIALKPCNSKHQNVAVQTRIICNQTLRFHRSSSKRCRSRDQKAQRALLQRRVRPAGRQSSPSRDTAGWEWCLAGDAGVSSRVAPGSLCLSTNSSSSHVTI